MVPCEQCDTPEMLCWGREWGLSTRVARLREPPGTGEQGNLEVGADTEGELYVLMTVCSFPPGPCVLGTPFPRRTQPAASLCNPSQLHRQPVLGSSLMLGSWGWWHEGTLSDRRGAGPRTNGCWVSATPCASTTWAPPSPPRCLSTDMHPVVLSPSLIQAWIFSPNLSLPHSSPHFTSHPTPQHC